MKRLFIVIFLLWINDLVFTDTTLYISNLWGRYSISIFRVVRKEKIFKKLNSPFIAFMVLLSLACCNWKIKCYGSYFFFDYISMGVKIFTGFYIFVLLLCVSWDIVIAGSIIQLFTFASRHDICTSSNWFSFSFVFRHFKRTEVYIFLFLVVEFASGEFDIRLGTVVLCGKF